jgi:hypothetical protein
MKIEGKAVVVPGGASGTGDAEVNALFGNGATFIKSIAPNC